MTLGDVYELLGRRGQRRVSLAICIGLAVAPASMRALITYAARAAGQSAAAEWRHVIEPLATPFSRSVQEAEQREHRRAAARRRRSGIDMPADADERL